MPVEYKRTDDPDIFLEITTQTKELSLKKLEEQVAELDKQIQEHGDEVPIDKVTEEQKTAIEFYNLEIQEMIRHIVEEKNELESLIAKLKALPEKKQTWQ